MFLQRLIFCLLAYYSALFFRQQYLSDWLTGPSQFKFYEQFFFPAFFCSLFFAYLEGFFTSNFRYRALNQRLYTELKIGFFSFCALSMLAFGLSFHLFSRVFLFLFVLLQFFYFAGFYSLFRTAIRRRKKVLCIGAEVFFRGLKQWITQEGLPFCFIEASEQLNLDIIAPTLEKYEPEEIFLCQISPAEKQQLFQMAAAMNCNNRIVIRDLDTLSRIFSAQKDFTKYREFLFLFFAEQSNLDFTYRLKRVVDLVLLWLLLPFCLPLLLLISFILWLSGQRVFFSQLRVGQMGRIFAIYKFCTMHETANYEKPQNAQDSRLTFCGRWLRYSSLDELPQLFNILKGDMSFVGPRPEILQIVTNQYLDMQWKRLLLKPGLTGLWQIYGRKQPIHSHLKYDFYYLKHQSIWLDIWILLKTIPTVIFRPDAR